VLAGGANCETLNGGLGDDTYVFGLEGRDIGNDHVIDASGGGSDTFDFSEASSGIRIDLDLQNDPLGIGRDISAADLIDQVFLAYNGGRDSLRSAVISASRPISSSVTGWET